MRASFYVLILSFLTGVAWRSFFSVGLAEAGMVLLVSVVVYGFSRFGNTPHALYAVLAGTACCVGLVRTEFAYQAYERARVYEDGALIESEGFVSVEPDVRDAYTVLWIDVPYEESSQVVRLRAKVPTYPEYVYGDNVVVRGKVYIPRTFITETGREFDYAGFLMKDGVHYDTQHPTITHVDGQSGNTIITSLLHIKSMWLDAVSRSVTEPVASLAGGIIVGAKRSLGEHWLELFRVTGIIHIVVLSGYNLTLIANVIVRLCGRLPRLYACMFGILGIVAFALMVGGGATVVRASIMAMLGMLATFLTRPYMVVRGLAFAGFCMVAWNPFVLVFDAGFQLSFMATLGLVLGAPLVAQRLTFLPELFQLREIASATLATQIAVLPLLLYHIGNVSLVAPVVNVLVLPVIPFAMLTGFLMGIVGIFSYALAFPFAWITHMLLTYTLFVVDLFSRIPYASVSFPAVSWWFFICLYVGMVWYYRTYARR